MEDEFIPDGVWTTTANIHPGSITQIILSNPAGVVHDASRDESLRSVRDFTFPRDLNALSAEVEFI